MKRVAISLLAGFTMSVAAAETFQEGQVWHYQTRAREESSRLFIVKIDHYEKLGPIYHIALDGLKLRNPHIEGGLQTDLPHMPIDEAALHDSVTQMISANAPMPDISEGYGHWKAALDTDEGGIFTIPVEKAVGYIEKAINQ